jgi:L-lactate dehydrogenase
MKVSLGIIGMGWVGSSIAISILHQGLCNELLIADQKKEIAEGEALDLNDGMPFMPTSLVRAVEIDEMLGCDVIVITAGRGGKPGESRLELLTDNISIARSISEQLKEYKGILIIVANPVDVLTRYYRVFTGLPAGRVIGTGTFLDSARLREIVADKLQLDSKSISADVIGEHGDSSVVVWSRASVGSIPLRTWPGWNLDWEQEASEKVRRSAQEIIKRKGATNHAIGLVTATLLKWILRGQRRVISVCTDLSGPYGLHDVALSLPSVISGTGVQQVLEPELDQDELKALHHSASVLRKAIESVK